MLVGGILVALIFGVALVAYDNSAGGLSRDGRRLVVDWPANGLANAKTRFVVLDPRTLRVRSRITLNGNFYTSAPIAFPAKVVASSCPDVAPMSTSITQAMAGCNQSGCHVAGAQGKIHLP